jgi:alkanesulfonate monooxygenase SsuD/methylene tetrahydromethanopterin reductase-like flavin-dependent oxidoreductase (luciferase family)
VIQEPHVNGSISIGLYAPAGPADQQITSLISLARCSERAGFDGVSVAEHHAGTPGYIPIPLLAVSWILDETKSIWAAACPILLPLVSAGSVAEAAAWLSVRYPGRVVVGAAPGYLKVDFDIASVELNERRSIFWERLPQLLSALSGTPTTPLLNDPAVRQCREHPVPVLCAAAGPVGVRRAARMGAGILLNSYLDLKSARELCREYVSAGGTGPRVLIRRCWIGTPEPGRIERLARSTKSALAVSDWLAGAIMSADSSEVASAVVRAFSAIGATALNLRLNRPGAGATEVSEQIDRVGSEVLGQVREAAGMRAVGVGG